MRVLIDTTALNRAPSGTAVYLERLLPALEALGVTVLTARLKARPRGGGGPRSYANAALALAWTQVELPARARRSRADLLHHPLPAHCARLGQAQVLTVHDVAFELLSECFDAKYRWAARRAHRRAVVHADAVIVPSQATAADVHERWGIDSERVVLAPHGPGQAPLPARRAVEHFLYVGDAEPRKNLPRLLEAYARYRAGHPAQPAGLPSPVGRADGGPLDLVLAGRARADGRPGVRHEPEPDLPGLHARAAALLLPSLHEGFGLTALEAMHAGTPVLTSSGVPALTELCADAARYVDPRDTDDLVRGLVELATVPPLREALRRRGLARAAEFTWERSARAHLRAYSLARR